MQARASGFLQGKFIKKGAGRACSATISACFISEIVVHKARPAILIGAIICATVAFPAPLARLEVVAKGAKHLQPFTLSLSKRRARQRPSSARTGIAPDPSFPRRRESKGACSARHLNDARWIPAFAGMTAFFVCPAAGAQAGSAGAASVSRRKRAREKEQGRARGHARHEKTRRWRVFSVQAQGLFRAGLDDRNRRGRGGPKPCLWFPRKAPRTQR